MPLKVACPSLRALAQARVYARFSLLHRERDSIGPRPDDAQASWHFAGVPEGAGAKLLPPIPEARWVTLAPNPRMVLSMPKMTRGFSGLGTGLLRSTRKSAIEGQNGSVEVAIESSAQQEQNETWRRFAGSVITRYS